MPTTTGWGDVEMVSVSVNGAGYLAPFYLANVIGGNGNAGILLSGTTITNTIILGNKIGTNDINVGLDFGNSGHGIHITNGASGAIVGAPVNYVGGSVSSTGNYTATRNIIFHNGGDGVRIDGNSEGNLLISNHIGSNDGLGVDLGGDGVTANDAGDGDNGSNKLQNYPTILYALPTNNGTTVAGELQAMAGQRFRLEFYRNASCDPSGYGEGQVMFGQADVVTDLGGVADFVFTFDSVLANNEFVTMLAIDGADNSSEFSQCRQVGGADLSISKNVSPNPALFGDNITFTLSVQNHGSFSATNTVLTDTLASGLHFVSATNPIGGCSEMGGVVSCTLGTMAGGQGITVTLVVTAENAGNYANSAEVISSAYDPDPHNNSDTAYFTVLPMGTVFVVNTISDNPDNNVGDGICEIGGGFCSLRAAIQESNFTAGSVEAIQFNIAGTNPLYHCCWVSLAHYHRSGVGRWLYPTRFCRHTPHHFGWFWGRLWG